MDLLHRAMVYYPYVFHPITVLGAGILAMIHYEWTRQDADRSVLWRRVGAFLGAGALALLPTAAYFLIVGANPIAATQGNSFTMDALVASGLFIAAGVTWYLWRRFDWGVYVPGMMQVLVAATVPYAVLSTFWNVSGHVIIALVPALYLTLVDRKFWPTMAIPVVMVPNRIAVDAHTWAQSIGGFLIAGLIVVGLYYRQTGTLLQSESGSPAS